MSTQPAITIETDKPAFTFINVFTVAPERQEELLHFLVEVTEKTMRQIPGFLAASFHKSLDGRFVVNYAQWLSGDYFNAMLANPAAQKHFEEARSIAENIQPIPCMVSYVGCEEANYRSAR